MKKIFAVIAFIMLTTVSFLNAQTKVAITSADYPKGITTSLSKDFVGYTVLESYKITNKKLVTYEITVQKNVEKLLLVYNKKGTLTKRNVLQADNKEVKPDDEDNKQKPDSNSNNKGKPDDKGKKH